MLLSLTDIVTIFMHPEYVAIARQTGFLNKKIIYKDFIYIDKTQILTDEYSVINALRNLLKKPEWNNCNTQVILSGDFTNFRVVKWNENLSLEEKKMLALNECEEIYGVKGATLHLCISDSGYRKNSLAFCLEESLYVAILNLEKERLLKLKSISPYFGFITNYWCKSIHKSAWIIVRENTRIYVAKLLDNSWELIKSITPKQDWVQDVKMIMAREMMQIEEAAMTNQVYFYGGGDLAINTEKIKSIHQGIIILDHFDKNESISKYMFPNFIV